MRNIAEGNFTLETLRFNYLNLNKYLYELYSKDIYDINILLLISLETEYYEGDTLKQILLDLKKLSNNLICQFDIIDEEGNPTGKKTEKVKFKANKILLDVGDVLNRHRWIYRYLEEYMLQNKLTDENEITETIKKEIEEKAYIAGKQQGRDWFKRNSESFDLLLPAEAKLDKNFTLGDEITEIYEGSAELPKIDYICYEYWLKHPEYGTIKNILDKIRSLPKSILEKTYREEAKYFLRRLIKRDEIQHYPKMFIEYSKNYLQDETIKHALVQKDTDNNLEFYFGNEVWHNLTFRSEKAKRDKTINNYIKNELFSLTKARNVRIKSKHAFT